MVALGKRYQNFPKYSMWATLANSLSQNLTNILISSFYSVATLGFYSLVQRVLGIPSSLIGGAVGQVFFQQATKEKQETGRSIKSFKSTIKKLFIIGIPFFGILFFIIEDLFTIVFGKEWQVAGKYAQLTIPLFFIKFISSTMSSILIIYEKQKNELMINILLMTTSIGLMLYFKEFNTFLFFFTIAMVMNYIIFLLYYYRLSKGYE
jgi:O-antigen/teichoic acid export membrane protein